MLLNLTTNQNFPPPQSVSALFCQETNTCQRGKSFLLQSLDNRPDLQRLKTCLHSLSPCHKVQSCLRWNESLTPTRSHSVRLSSETLVCNLYKPAPSPSSPLTDVKINRSSYFQHIIITLQDKHLIPVQYRSEQMILGLILSAPKWDDIELDYARKWGVHANWK